MENFPQPWKRPHRTIPADLSPTAGLTVLLQGGDPADPTALPHQCPWVTQSWEQPLLSRGKQLTLESSFAKVKSGTVTEQPDKHISLSPWGR